MKRKVDLHKDYTPHSIITHFKSKVVSGIIVLLCYRKTKNLTTIDKILKFFLIIKTKEIYYWLPYRRVLEGSNKYSVIGPKTRFPYAAQWFEVKGTHNIYKQGLDEFGRLHSYAKQVKTTLPFNEKDMLILTRKAVIKMLDEFVFAKTKPVKARKQQHLK